MAASTAEICQLVQHTFSTEIWWSSVVFDQNRLQRIWFGYRNQLDLNKITQEIGAIEVADSELSDAQRNVVELVTDYCAGHFVDFRDVDIDLDNHTPFQRKVINACRKIPFGKTKSYGELASKAGSPFAARAVGSTMAKNIFPLIVPCHRVVGSSGKLHGFSAPDGLNMKARLLKMEHEAV
ncbi:MAG: methylated-DNA--[protein]-cysteine S-methyltransferase [Pirellulales bacterium]|jgi:methylated-DNA-[protein]-cysteine S-methyltransferase